MTAPTLLTADDWTDYALLDSGDGWKLERFGPYRFARPEPQALWRAAKPVGLWRTDARFSPAADEGEDMGRWRRDREVPESWPIAWNGLSFYARCTPFRHLGVFPEQSVHWRAVADALAARGSGGEVLNLFGYTGVATLVAAAAGAKVTHVDASKKAIFFARQNQALAGLETAQIRWIVDDALGFVRRELRRGRRYDAIILDPPKFGRGPNGETWRLDEGLQSLLHACAQLLRADPQDPSTTAGLLVATVYAVRLSYAALAQCLADGLETEKGVLEAGEMMLPHADDARLLPTAIFARWRG
jgi:23S rRNA (cytosine1962-C5)-methyltransferase